MEFNEAEITEAFPSATVVLVRDGVAGLEVLMVCRSKQVKHMGGMWVFPGGRVDPEDQVASGDVQAAAVNAAIRETQEEAGLDIAADHLYYISHWTTPEGAKKRFATWFFVGVLEQEPWVHRSVVHRSASSQSAGTTHDTGAALRANFRRLGPNARSR